MPNQACDKVAKGSRVGAPGVALSAGRWAWGCPGVGDQDGNWGQKTGQLPHSLPLLSLTSTLGLWPSPLRLLWPQVRCGHKFTADLAERHSHHAAVQPRVSAFVGRLPCLGSRAPRGQEVAGEAIRGLSRNQGVMGRRSEWRLAGTGQDGVRAALFSPSHLAPGSATLSPHPWAFARLSPLSEIAFLFLSKQLGLAGSLSPRPRGPSLQD